MILEKKDLILENKEVVQAVYPIILSASRATDIPAFYSDWFFNNFEKGYFKWINPFNRKIQYVSVKNTRVIVFWSKYPYRILPYLEILDKKKINYYFQFTINDYEDEGIEPDLPSLNKRVELFKKLSLKIGKEKVILRFDPLILYEEDYIDRLINKINSILKILIDYTDKLVISFVDIMQYKKVQRNFINFNRERFNKENISNLEFSDIQKIEFAKRFYKYYSEYKKINPEFSVSTCSENINLFDFGISHNSCIDDKLMSKLFYEDKLLMEFLKNTKNLKDKGQRKDCRCIISKDIGQYNTCKFNCVYCYAKSFSQKNNAF